VNRGIACAFTLMAACGGSSSSVPDPGSGADPVVPGPPSDVHAVSGPAWNQCVLAWTPPLQEVDSYEIMTDAPGWSFDDADTHGGIAPRGSMAVLDFSQTYLAELSPVAIRIRSRNHGAVSAFTPPVTCRLPVLAPFAAAVTLQADGIAVAWDALSTVASTYDVERATLDASGAPGTWSSIATLPAPAPIDFDQRMIDGAAHPAGSAYAYRVSAVAPGGERGTSPPATSATLGAALTTSTVMLPPSIVTIADRAGHYAMVGALSGSLVYTWGNGTQWTNSPPIAATPYAPFVKLDALGLPHAVYGKPATGFNVVDITHGWSDGAQWHEETIATRFLTSSTATPTLAFDLDATGTPVLMWTVGGVNASYEVAHKAAGSWIIQPLDELTTARVFGSYTMFTDASGVVHLAIAAALELRHLQLTNNAWSDERAPGAPTFGLLVATGRDPSHLAICFDDFGSTPRCVRKTPAGWSPLEWLSPVPTGLSFGGIGWLAMSDDGQRLALLHQNRGSQLFRSDAPGVWNEIAFPQLGAGQFEPTQLLGFDAAGKLFILVDPNAAIDQASTTVAYERRFEP